MSGGLTGITVDDACVTTFNELKVRKAGRYVIFHIVNNATVNVAEVGPRETTFQQFVDKLGRDEPCYAVFDFEYNDGDVPRAKLLLLTWIPDTAKPKPKMVYASTAGALKAKIEGGLVEMQATDKSEITIEAVMHKIGGRR